MFLESVITMPTIQEYGVQDNDRAPYLVHVYAPDHGVSVRAYIPEQIEASLRSNYDTPFAEGFLRSLPHGERLHLAAHDWQATEPPPRSCPCRYGKVPSPCPCPFRSTFCTTTM